MSVYAGPEIINDGLVLALDATNSRSYPGSGTTWTDLTGNSNNGTLVDGPTYSDGSLVFNGVANRVNSTKPIFKWTADGTIGYQEMTISLWVKTTDTGGNFYSKPWNGSGQYNMTITPTAFSILSGGTSGNSLGFDSSIYDGNWKNVVCWVNATNMGHYLNASISASKAHGLTGNAPSVGDGNLGFCLMSLFPYSSGWAGNTGFSINGNMAICKVYSRVLTAAEVSQNFNAIRGRFGI
jgi:hypothetical protein